MFKIIEKRSSLSEAKIYAVYSVERVSAELTLFLIFDSHVGWQWVDSYLYEPYLEIL